MYLSILMALLSVLPNNIVLQDSIKTMTLDEVNVVSTLKESGTLRQQAMSSSRITNTQINDRGVNSLRNLGTLVPNFFMPEYGSRQTSSIYMRGIGSRIGTPAVGLYVDNVAYYDKSAFDFSFYDVESIDVLRGPQSTLYGRNAMSGLIRVHTRNPFDYNGTDVRLGFGVEDLHRQLSVNHYHRVSDKFAFSISGFYDGSNGFFRNDSTDKKVDASESGGARFRAIYKNNKNFKLDASVGYEYSDEGAYPYYYTGTTNGTEHFSESIGRITSNLEARYRRSLFNASVNAEWHNDLLTFNSVTAYQNLNDRMFMDQDFLATDIYSLEQKQKISTLSEEILLKNNGKRKWNWIAGANIFYQWQHIIAPVTFRKDGVNWLNGIINDNANKFMSPVIMGPMTMNFLFADNIQGNHLAFNSDFDTPTFGAALFHQSTFNDLFGIEGLSAALGLRLDYETMKMIYNTNYSFSHIYSLKGILSGMMNREIEMVPEAEYSINNKDLCGKLSNNNIVLLPKLTIKYDFNLGNVYATVSRGYRSGGHNVQNISELLRIQMQTDMMKNVRDVTIPVLDEQKMVPSDTKENIKSILNKMASAEMPDIQKVCRYKPEFAWNYEIGTHLSFINNKLNIDVSTFLTDVKNVQISTMSETGLGRVTINAGDSRSVGTEIMISTKPIDNLNLTLMYGYTHSTFSECNIQKENDNIIDCKGNFVPYVPAHTINFNADYTVLIKRSKLLNSFTYGIDFSGVGKIYWNEENSYSQPFYGMLGMYLNLAFTHGVSLQLWGRNLTDTHYNTFWFDSMDRGFEQHGKPLQVGVTASIHF